MEIMFLVPYPFLGKNAKSKAIVDFILCDVDKNEIETLKQKWNHAIAAHYNNRGGKSIKITTFESRNQSHF